MTTATPARASDPAPAVQEAIEATIADYYLGWYDGDADRMARALHPRLAKRGWLRDTSGIPAFDGDDFTAMVEYTRRGQGRTTDPDRRRYEVRAVEVYDDIASACVYAVPYVDYLHLVRTDDGWRIMNALWRKP
ncbi:MAG TPA: nuclear transport factor 2 family protein, partial [Candidatus Limnocylindrales bacterium]|nr:nuclear transport factor 2 family protein [Candidatus Limnocylindrales bacterium]